MSNQTPRLEIFPHRIESNARLVIDQCSRYGVQVACVTKVLRAHPAVVQALEAAGAGMLADSRLINLQAIARTGSTLQRMLLRLPAPSQAVDAVRSADFSLNSSLETMALLSQAAGLLQRTHRVILMVDLGDLREGIWPDRLVTVIRKAGQFPNIEIAGIGANLACFGGVVPTSENMNRLVELRNACRDATGFPLDLLSGGNSANLPLLVSGGMPVEVNHLRIGEAIILGRNVLDRSPWPGTRQDTVRLVAEVIEIERKPSVPVGLRGQDAFGCQGEIVDRGIRKRALCNIGRQDVLIDGITPQDPGIIVLGGSSDHLVLDVEEALVEIKLGDEIAFYPCYGSLLAAATSPYVHKVISRD